MDLKIELYQNSIFDQNKNAKYFFFIGLKTMNPLLSQARFMPMIKRRTSLECSCEIYRSENIKSQLRYSLCDICAEKRILHQRKIHKD